MDLENQKRVKDFADEYGAENLVVVLGAAEGEAAGLAAETVTAGDVRVKSLRQVVTAAADGAIAAVQVERSMSDYF